MRAILEVIYGRLLTIHSPVKYADMTDGERGALLSQYQQMLDADLKVLDLKMAEQYATGASRSVARLRDAFEDKEAFDDVVECLDNQKEEEK